MRTTPDSAAVIGWRFNGSTVRKPWLCLVLNPLSSALPVHQWVHGLDFVQWSSPSSCLSSPESGMRKLAQASPRVLDLWCGLLDSRGAARARVPPAQRATTAIGAAPVRHPLLFDGE